MLGDNKIADNLSSKKTNYKSWLAKAVTVLAGVSLSVALFSNWMLYEAAYNQEMIRLAELAKTQAILIDAIATFDAEHSKNAHPQGAAAATFSQLEAAHREYPGFGETGEFTLGTLKDGNIIFLLSHRHFDFTEPVPIPWKSDLGEPMRRALRGESGMVVGLDYRGEMVLAAHEPLPKLNAGIVAKIDITEIRKPFIRAAQIGFIGLLMMVSIGALVFRRISIPLVEREKALTDLRLLSHAIDQSPNMMFITNIKGVIEYINPRFTEFTGYTSEEVIGQTPRILKSEDTAPEVYADMWGELLAGREWRGEIKDRRKDGGVFWASMVAAPVRDDEGEICHFIAIHEDITQFKLAQERTHHALEQAEIASRAKSELMANMSHELRTPLNAIIGFSATMNEQIFGPMANDKYEEYAHYINVSGTHLLEVINDILDVSGVEAGKLVLHEESVDLVEIVDAAIRIISPKAQEGCVSITGLTEQNLPRMTADPRRLKQILLNLLSNAVKFTPERGEVSCAAFVDDDGALVLTVTDNGVGMDEAGLTKAMMQFGQVDSSLTRKHEGTGLGLSLTQGLVELHGGTMTLASAPGKGTTVTMHFPAERMIAVAS